MAFKHSYDADSLVAGKWEVTGRIVTETEKAILLDDGVMRAWLPKSKVQIEPLKDDQVTVYMPEWLAREKKYV
jgi:hypothetical protein